MHQNTKNKNLCDLILTLRIGGLFKYSWCLKKFDTILKITSQLPLHNQKKNLHNMRAYPIKKKKLMLFNILGREISIN